MYIIDYKKELIKKFNAKEMSSFLNHEIITSSMKVHTSLMLLC